MSLHAPSSPGRRHGDTEAWGVEGRGSHSPFSFPVPGPEAPSPGDMASVLSLFCAQVRPGLPGGSKSRRMSVRFSSLRTLEASTAHWAHRKRVYGAISGHIIIADRPTREPLFSSLRGNGDWGPLRLRLTEHLLGGGQQVGEQQGRAPVLVELGVWC